MGDSSAIGGAKGCLVHVYSYVSNNPFPTLITLFSLSFFQFLPLLFCLLASPTTYTHSIKHALINYLRRFGYFLQQLCCTKGCWQARGFRKRCHWRRKCHPSDPERSCSTQDVVDRFSRKSHCHWQRVYMLVSRDVPGIWPDIDGTLLRAKAKLRNKVADHLPTSALAKVVKMPSMAQTGWWFHPSCRSTILSKV